MKVVPLALLLDAARRLPGRLMRLHSIVAAGAVAGSLFAVPPAHAQAAQEQQALDSIYLLPSRSTRLPSASLTARDILAAEPAATTQARPSPAPYGSGGSSLSRASLIQMPAEVIPGRYTRPKYALGFRSSTMKGLAKDMGLDADTCLLPLVRARVSFSQDEGAGGRVMIFARCTFH